MGIRIHKSLLIWLLASTVAAAQTSNSVYDLTLGELGNIRISSGASLTKTEAGKVPASVTTITRQMIAESAARSLDELLDIYVPNLARLEVAGGPGPKIGMRGILGGRNHKTLLLVNGRVMNQRTIYGAVSERFLPLLGDIESIEVVRGPGSAVYGPGAINGVISIRTSARGASRGLEATYRQGLVEGYTLGEVRFARTLGARSSIFGYYGIDDYRGADPIDSPLTLSKTKTLSDGTDLFTAGVPVDSGIVFHNKAFEGKLHHKAHFEYRHGGSALWARFVRGGLNYLPARSVIESNLTFTDMVEGMQYQQFTIQGEQAVDVGLTVTLHLRASYDIHDVIKDVAAQIPDREYTSGFREDELNLRSMLSWTPQANQSVAVGLDYSREWFGKAPWGLTDDPAHNSRTDYEPWTTNMTGLLAEYQWNANDSWTAFLGGRMDKHTFTQWMASPKAALVFSPSESHTAKLFYNSSVRKSDDIELKQQNDANPDSTGEIEKVNSLELRHDYRIRADILLSAAVFWQDVDIIGYVGAPRFRTRPIGNEEIFGVEVEGEYTGSRLSLTGSYAFTKMLEFTLLDESIRNQTETSAPYGYGNDLHHWPWHVGKLTWRWQVTRKLRATSSLRLLWGFKGAESYADYNNKVLKQNSLTRTDDGRTEAFQGSVFLSSGVIYSTRQGVRLGLHAHNVLGWLQHDLNKRNFFGRMAGYRSEAPAISIRLGYGL